MSTNVYAKFRCAPLRIKKALDIVGSRRTDSNNKNNWSSFLGPAFDLIGWLVRLSWLSWLISWLIHPFIHWWVVLLSVVVRVWCSCLWKKQQNWRKPTLVCCHVVLQIRTVRSQVGACRQCLLLNFAHRSQWSSGNVSDCGVRRPKFEFHCGQLRVFRKNHYNIQPWAWAAHSYCSA